MSLATTSTFTLSDLANIALGSTELTNEHLRVLQTLLIILLQKLNCHNETVRIQGFPAKCLENLLKNCTATGQYNFQMKTIQKYQEKYELLDEFEKKAQEIDLKLEKHFQEIRNCHKTNMFEAKFWDFYASSDEDLCTLYKRSNKELCFLASNSKFNKELRSRVSQPVVKRLKEFEITIERMQNKLKDVEKLLEKAAAKQNCIQYIIKHIEDMREALKTNEKQFREAMSEAQEMLNCKLERVTLPALKIYLEQSFDKIKDYLKVLKKQQNKCPLLKPMIVGNKNTCLSCGYNDELELQNQLKPLNFCDLRFKCFCNNSQKEPTILEKIDRMKLNEVGDIKGKSKFWYIFQ